ncbi:chemotaxis protein MotB [Arboricoccus pini]|uniref:Chemotaxis protein MotB n=1 Tax=Arboricoccus pini TaxID=1963835 RepID=A0A212R708_9PROT|nr:peptidoglycan -binding protein [Arboricoccus pini]SNB67954.1 chemotaxis protein MotB [Arboricoccus pini]
MARRRSEARAVDIWPGFVDALSTLLLAFIFLLVVFVLGQFFLSQQLVGRDQEVSRLGQQIRDLTSKLGLSASEADDLRRSLAQTSADLQAALTDKDALAARLDQSEAARADLNSRLAHTGDDHLVMQRRLDELEAGRSQSQSDMAALQHQLDEARKTVSADQDKLKVQLAQLVQLQADIAALRQVRSDLEKDVADLTSRSTASDAERTHLLAELGTTRDNSAALEAKLADAEQKTMLAQRELQAREIRLTDLLQSTQSLTSSRDQALQGQADAVAEVQALRLQLTDLGDQLRRLANALDAQKTADSQKDAKIEELGKRLNLALVNKVEELDRSRSDFFGKLREVLGDRSDVQIVGDRFVFPSDVLFTSGDADIGQDGRDQLAKLATALKDIITQIPNDLPWVLQVDGHTDIRPISNARFPSNWELSSARAIAVARFLIDQGIPPDRVAARGFAQFQPLDPGTSEEAYRRNRRIEIKLTTR